MTIPILGGAPYPLTPYSNIIPFTVRDGSTFLEVLEQLRAYIRDILTPHMETEIAALTTDYTAQTNLLIEAVNLALVAQLNQVNADISDNQAQISSQFADQDSSVAAAIAAIIDSTIAVTDPVVVALVTAVDSATRVAIDAIVSAGAANEKIRQDLDYVKTVEMPLNALNEGVKGDGVTDDSAAINALFVKWGALARPGALIFPPNRKYKCDTPLILAPTTHSSSGHISAKGSEFIFALGTGYGFTVDPTINGKVISQLTISDLNIVNAGFRIVGGGLRNEISSFFYGWKFTNITVSQAGNSHGILIDGPFEGQLYSPIVAMLSTNTVFDAIHIEATASIAAGGDNSSIEVYSPTTRHGARGIYASLTDAKFYGGTVLEAKSEGFYYANAEGGVVSGIHAENCWRGATVAAENQAGIKVTGMATIEGCTGHKGTGFSSNVVSVYAVGKMTIIGGGLFGLTNYAHLDGSAGSTVLLIGTPGVAPGYTYNYGFAFTNGGKIMRIGGDKDFEFIGAGRKILTYSRATETAATTGLRTALVALGLVTDATVA